MPTIASTQLRPRKLDAVPKLRAVRGTPLSPPPRAVASKNVIMDITPPSSPSHTINQSPHAHEVKPATSPLSKLKDKPNQTSTGASRPRLPSRPRPRSLYYGIDDKGRAVLSADSDDEDQNLINTDPSTSPRLADPSIGTPLSGAENASAFDKVLGSWKKCNAFRRVLPSK